MRIVILFLYRGEEAILDPPIWHDVMPPITLLPTLLSHRLHCVFWVSPLASRSPS